MRVLPIALGLGFRVLSIRLRPGQRLVSMPFILRFLNKIPPNNRGHLKELQGSRRKTD